MVQSQGLVLIGIAQSNPKRPKDRLNAVQGEADAG